MRHFSRAFACLSAALLLAFPTRCLACACGCGLFDVEMQTAGSEGTLRTSESLPTRPGGTAFLEYDYMNQDQNWSGAAKAPAENNADLRIRTHFMTAGAMFMFNRSWGAMAEVPLWQRYFQTTDDAGDIVDFKHAFVGDVRLRAVYTGLSSDMSTGLSLGVKLPNGNYKNPDYDRDTQVGTGSTDLLLGAYRTGLLPGDGWRWFANGLWDEPTLTAAGYRPGAELDALAGAGYTLWRPGGVEVAPLAQAIGSVRWRDAGTAAHPGDTGYRRLFLAPGVELAAAGLRLDGEVGFPVWEYFNGNQLAASRLYKVRLGYGF